MFGNPRPAVHFDEFPDGGGYPLRFVEWIYEQWNVTDPTSVLHLCSGSMTSGIRIDIRLECQPDFVADCRTVPMRDESFDFIMADPPYSEDYAKDLYDTAQHYPRPGQIAKEACRLLRPGGYFGLLHVQVPMTRKPLRVEAVYGITTGAGYAIRAFTVCRKGSRVLCDAKWRDG